MAKTSIAAREHIRAWSEFFADCDKISRDIADEFIKRHRKKKYLKQSLRRLIQNGFIVERGSSYALTTKGVKHLGFFADHLCPKRKWDGKWRLISFDVPENDRLKRSQLRSLLKEFNFFQLQKSVWACPDILCDAFWKLLVDKELDKYCSAMVVKIIEGDGELKKHFSKIISSALCFVFVAIGPMLPSLVDLIQEG